MDPSIPSIYLEGNTVVYIIIFLYSNNDEDYMQGVSWQVAFLFLETKLRILLDCHIFRVYDVTIYFSNYRTWGSKVPELWPSRELEALEVEYDRILIIFNVRVNSTNIILGNTPQNTASTTPLRLGDIIVLTLWIWVEIGKTRLLLVIYIFIWLLVQYGWT